MHDQFGNFSWQYSPSTAEFYTGQSCTRWFGANTNDIGFLARVLEIGGKAIHVASGVKWWWDENDLVTYAQKLDDKVDEPLLNNLAKIKGLAELAKGYL
jgi:hypothetical protein